MYDFNFENVDYSFPQNFETNDFFWTFKRDVTIQINSIYFTKINYKGKNYESQS